MWIATTCGFYSVVTARRRGMVQVRARSRADLLALRRQSGAALAGARIIRTPQADYPFRIVVSKATWATVARRLANAIDYRNFKNAVAESNPARAQTYGLVWWELQAIEKETEGE